MTDDVNPCTKRFWFFKWTSHAWKEIGRYVVPNRYGLRYTFYHCDRCGQEGYDAHDGN